MKKLVVTFALLGLSIASAKSYSITLSNPAVAGNLQLKPGDYKVKLVEPEGKAVFTDMVSGKKYETQVKAGSMQFNHNQTQVQEPGLEVNHNQTLVRKAS